MTERFIGLMSGTSMDGVDGVLVEFSGARLNVMQHAHEPFPEALRSEFFALNTPGENELHRAALASNALARLYADTVQRLLRACGLHPQAVAAIGAHGQTVRHQPQRHDGTGYTLQLNNPALLAELTGIDVVADFRSRDVAAGGQGAPLVPAFHQALFGQAGTAMAILNLGGISNLSVLRDNETLGFDCGPANALMDAWCLQHQGEPFDQGGAWARSGSVELRLLDQLMSDPYFAMPPPKSTGRDLFNPAWLERQLKEFAHVSPVDVQATLLELTALSSSQAILRHAADCQRLMVCGGGALNATLMQRLQHHLPGLCVGTTDQAGLPPMQVEATAFAWLARQTVHRQAIALQNTTGAKGARVLGAIYPR